ncbi:aspartate/glutamate racemase family protein [Sulfurimonas sp. HSL-3221]|uniref:aspartate/glutamate racemase family protein n=1 Tax=Sulfurimonadaceae TaxID=2771471 RepID=UPI001E2B1F8F|nr:aspartate/glutamate racemase family protein [Sulfurimonas sp. HSL-3221]UFS63352.1 aspartate/glutamate racemase family protein [Sulfurimonas sp. HSL-3221]
MKTIGLIGGVSWESSSEYYRLINQAVKSQLGALHSAELVMYSLDFEPVARLEHDEEWDRLSEVLGTAAHKLELAGASFVLIASNTLHKVVPQVQQQLGIPIVHIADAVAEAVASAGVSTLGLLGTNFVMEQAFYRERLERHGLKIITPPKKARDFIHNVIYGELALGDIRQTSRTRILEMIGDLKNEGAEGIVLANTELPLLIRAAEIPMTLFDSMAIHIDKAVALALGTEAVQQMETKQ